MFLREPQLPKNNRKNNRPPWDPRLPEIGTGAPTSQYASNTVRISNVRASQCGGVCE